MKIDDFTPCKRDEEQRKYIKSPDGELVWGSHEIAPGTNSEKIMNAVKNGDIETVEELLDNGASPDSHDAIKEKYWEYADYASNISWFRHYSLLCYAIANEDDEMVELLLDHGANPLLSASVDGDALVTNPYIMAKQVGGEIFKLVSSHASQTEESEKEEERRKEEYEKLREESGFKGFYYNGRTYAIDSLIYWANKTVEKIEKDDFPYASMYAKANPNVPYLAPPTPRTKKILVKFDKEHSDEDNAKVVLNSQFYEKELKKTEETARGILFFYDKIEKYNDFWETEVEKLRQEADKWVADAQKTRDWYSGSGWYKEIQERIKFYDNRDKYAEKAEHILDAIDALKDAAAKSVIEPWGK